MKDSWSTFAGALLVASLLYVPVGYFAHWPAPSLGLLATLCLVGGWSSARFNSSKELERPLFVVDNLLAPGVAICLAIPVALVFHCPVSLWLPLAVACLMIGYVDGAEIGPRISLTVSSGLAKLKQKQHLIAFAGVLAGSLAAYVVMVAGWIIGDTRLVGIGLGWQTGQILATESYFASGLIRAQLVVSLTLTLLIALLGWQQVQIAPADPMYAVGALLVATVLVTLEK